MDLLWLLHCVVASVCVCLSTADRYGVFWNSTNPKFQLDDYVVEVHLNDYLDIVCPHYPLLMGQSQEAERYVLYMVEREEYETCQPQSYEQMRWECDQPFALHGPEKFSEKFQRFTPFTLGKEFRPGQSYYYISKPLHHHGQECLKLRVDVVVNNGSQEAKVGPGKGAKAGSGGGAHYPFKKLAADDPVIVMPEVQKSVRTNSAYAIKSTIILTMLPTLLLLLLIMQ